MVHVLPPTESFGEKIGKGLGSGISGGFGQMIQNYLQKQQLQQDYAQKLGLQKEKSKTDMEKIDFQEKLKSQLKEGLLEKKQDFLRELLGSQGSTEKNGIGKPNLENLSDADLAQITVVDPNLGKFLQSTKEFSQREKQSSRDFEYKRAEPILKRADEMRESMPMKEMALEGLVNAIQTGNLGFFSLNNLADITGIEGLRDPNGTLFKSSVKEYFLGDISRVGARPNQWIEQQIADALPKMGRDPASNEIVTAGMQAKIDIQKNWLDELDKLEEFYKNKLGYIPGTIGKEVSKSVSKYAADRQKILKEDIERIKKSAQKPSIFKAPENVPEGYIYMYNPETGEELNILKEQVPDARKEGFRLSK